MGNRDVGVHNESGLFPEQIRAIRRVLPLEIETKIIDGVDIAAIQKNILEMGGTITREHVVILDRNFGLVKQKRNTIPTQHDVHFTNMQPQQSEQFRDALRYLGLPILAYDRDQQGGYYRVERPTTIPRRSVRLRKINNGDELFFTVKQKRKKSQGNTIDSRVEIEVPLAGTESIERLLREIGYEEGNDLLNQKDRTSYQFGGCVVEINSAPHLEIPDWIEIEGPSPEAIKNIAAQLGISQTAFRSMSLGDQVEYFKAKKESDA